MSRNWARILAGVLAVAVIWIAAYWWLNPRGGGTDKISFGAGPGALRAQAPSPPVKKVELVDLERPPLIAKSRESSPALSFPPIVNEPEPAPVASSKPVPANKPAPAVIPPRFSDYKVRNGDTLNAIASAELGSSKHADSIRRANPLKDLDRLKVGDVIRIPVDPTNIQGRPAAGSPSPAPPSDRAGEMLEYTVRSGDTLSRIAKEKYGNTSFQDLIYSANRDRLPSRNALKEGQTLRLPPKPKE